MRKGIAHIQAALVLLDVAAEELGDEYSDPKNDLIAGAIELLEEWMDKWVEEVTE